MSESSVNRLLLPVAGALLFLSFGFTEMAGSDMWWHVAAGRELLQTGTLWMVDDWSFSAWGGDWLNHEWLSDIIYFGWVSAWGVESLVYWKWLVIVSTFGLLQQALGRETGSPLAGLVCAVMALAIAAPFLDVRPHLYTLLNFSLLLYLLPGRSGSPALLACLFIIWVNLHGGFFFGLMALGILLFPWRNFSLDNLRGAFLLGMVCLLASALNPSGLKTFLYPLTYAFDSSSPFRQLGEWLSPFKPRGIRSPLFFVFMWVPLVGLLYLLPAVRRHTGVPWEGIALTGLTLAMALTSRRFISLFGISLAVMIAPLVAHVLQHSLRERARLALAVVALLAAVLRLQPYPLQAAPAFHYLTAEYSYPVDMLNFIEANRLQGNVYALYNWGGYIHWRTDGAMRVFIDGRADTLYDAATYNHYVNVLVSGPDWLAQVEATDADYFLWPLQRGRGQHKLRQLMETGRWRPVYRDSVSWLLARRSVQFPQDMRAAPDTPWRDLTIARQKARDGDNEAVISRAEQARAAMPWHKGACDLLTSAYRQLEQEGRAETVSTECRGYFPSRLFQ